MIRTILAFGFLFVFLVTTIPLMIFEWILNKFNPHAHDVSSLAIVNWAFGVVRFIVGAKVTVIGREKIPTDCGVLYIPNHRSFFDIILTYPLVAGPTGCVAKKEVRKIPLLGFWMQHLHCLFLDRSSAKAGLQMVLDAIEMEKKGISVCVFPEGTRNTNEGDELLPFREGCFKIATKSAAPIIPVTIVGSRNVFEAHMPYMRPAKVIIEFGDPIYTANLSKDEIKALPQQVAGIITETYIRNKALL